MNLRLFLVFLIPSFLYVGCTRMHEDFGGEPQTVALKSSSTNVKTASNIILTASVLYGSGSGIVDEFVEFYQDTTLIGTDITPTFIPPTSPNQSPSFSYDLSVSLTSSQNGTQTYIAKVKSENAVKTITSSPVAVVVAIP